MDYTFEEIRQSYPAAEGKAYLNTPAQGLVSIETVTRAKFELTQYLEQGAPVPERWRTEMMPALRRRMADFLGAGREEVAFVSNFSTGFNLLLTSIPKSTRILLIEQDYPSLINSARFAGFDIHWVPMIDGAVPMDRVRETILTEGIEVVMVSHVQFLSGYKIDLSELGHFCLEHGVFSVVDITQSVGAEVIDFKASGVDVIAGSVYKWMGAGHGNGVMCIASRFLDRFPPVVGGFNTSEWMGGPPSYEVVSTRYEVGHYGFLGFIMLDEALKEKEMLGMEQVAEYNRFLKTYLLQVMQSIGVEVLFPFAVNRSSALTFVTGGAIEVEALAQADVHVALRGEAIRLGPHIYNNRLDIDRFAEVLQSVRKN